MSPTDDSSPDEPTRSTSHQPDCRSRRKVLGQAGAVGVMLVSGCLDMFPSGDVQAEATPVTVADDTLSKTGYQFIETEEFGLQSGLDLSGEFNGVSVHSRISKYHRSTDVNGMSSSLPELYFTVSVPSFDMSGRTVHPLQEMSERDIIEAEGGVIDTTVSDEYDDVTITGKRNTRSMNLLGTTTDIVTFDAEARKNGTSVELLFSVAKTTDDGDQIAVVGVRPRKASSDSAFVRLSRALKHG